MTLIEYMDRYRVTCPGLATLLRDSGHAVTSHAVQKWRLGQRPNFRAIMAIEKATCGKVKPESFLPGKDSIKLEGSNEI